MIRYYISFRLILRKFLLKIQKKKKKKKRGELHPLRGNNIKEVQENRSCTSRSGRFRAKVESSVVREKGVRGVAEKGRKRGKMQRTSIDSPSAWRPACPTHFRKRARTHALARFPRPAVHGHVACCVAYLRVHTHTYNRVRPDSWMQGTKRPLSFILSFPSLSLFSRT